jgi:hypothetical protein
MPLEEKNSNEFVQYVQVKREAKDDYTKRKVQKDRHKAIKWLKVILENKEAILTFQHEGRIYTEFVTLKRPEDHRPVEMFPEAPLTTEIIHGEEVQEDQYVRCYHLPTYDPMLIHIDDVVCWIVTQENMNELHKEYEKRLYAD